MGGTAWTWDAGAQWQPESGDGLGFVWGPVAAPGSGTPALRVAIDGGMVTAELQAASWATGQPGLYGTIGATTATLRFVGTIDGDVGSFVVLTTDAGEQWQGWIDVIAESEGHRGQTYTTVTATDVVGRLGTAQFDAVEIDEGALTENVERVFALAGLSSVAELVTNGTDRVMLGEAAYTGSALDYLNRLVASANAVAAVMPDGAVRLASRAALDYHDRASLTNLSSIPNPAGDWQLNDASSPLLDVEASANGTGSGGITYRAMSLFGAGDPGYCVELDGVNGYVAVSDVHDFGATAAFSVALWVRIDTATDGVRLVSKEGAANLSGWRITYVAATDKIAFRRADAAAADECYTPAGAGDGDAHHVLVRFTGSVITAFLDGVAGTPVASTRSLPGNANALAFGRSANSAAGFLDGALQDVTIWAATLTDDDVVWLVGIAGRTALDGSGFVNGWTVTRSGSAILNAWNVTDEAETLPLSTTDAASIAAYGRKSFDLTDALNDQPAHDWPGGFRAIMALPLRDLSGSAPVSDFADWALSARPLDVVKRNGRSFLLLSVAHSVAPPTSWAVTVTGIQYQAPA